MGHRQPDPNQILCIGGATIDRKLHAVALLRAGTSNPVASGQTFGGVARNVAETLARLGVPTSFASLVGNDENGRAILAHLWELGIDLHAVARAETQATAEYTAVLEPNGDLAFGLADMAIFDAFGLADLARAWPLVKAASWVFADCNLPSEVLQGLVTGNRGGTWLAVNPVSAPKAAKLPRDLTGIDLLFLNLAEAAILLEDGGPILDDRTTIQALRERGAAAVVLTLGSRGVLVGSCDGIEMVPAIPAHLVDVTGAGDALIGTTLAGLLKGEPLARAAGLGALAAALTVESTASVRPDLSPRLLEAAQHRLPQPTLRSVHA